MYAGMDASGTPDFDFISAGNNPYVISILAVENREALQSIHAEIRRRHRIGANTEFHGHTMLEKVLADLLAEVHALNGRFGILMIDKELTRHVVDTSSLPSDMEIAIQARLLLLEKFLTHSPLALLDSDEDILGKLPQDAFKTEVKRLHRTLWPKTRLKMHVRDSKESELIQTADVSAYAFAHWARGSIKTQDLRDVVQRIREDNQNIVMGPMAWEV